MFPGERKPIGVVTIRKHLVGNHEVKSKYINPFDVSIESLMQTFEGLFKITKLRSFKNKGILLSLL